MFIVDPTITNITMTTPIMTALPPGHVNDFQVTMTTATTLAIVWTVSGDIDRFEVTYSYIINRCSAPEGATRMDVIFDGSKRSHTLRNLSEDSNYTVTVRAINTVGSTMATLESNTSTSGNVLWC